MSKTIATTIKADVVIYQDGSVEVITDCANHASGTPAVVELDEIGAMHCRRAFTPGELFDYGMRQNGLAASMSMFYDIGERAGYDWVREMFSRGELERIGDLSFDWDARRLQAQICMNTLADDMARGTAINGWCNGFSLAICEAFGKVANWDAVYKRHKRLNDNADIPNEEPAPTY